MFGSQLTKSCTGLETRLSRCPHQLNIDRGKSNRDNINRPKHRIRIRRCLPNNIDSGGVGRGQLGIGLVLPGTVQDSCSNHAVSKNGFFNFPDWPTFHSRNLISPVFIKTVPTRLRGFSRASVACVRAQEQRRTATQRANKENYYQALHCTSRILCTCGVH